MAKRKLTQAQKILIEKIPDFFQWHEKCRKAVEEIISEQIETIDDLENDVTKLKEYVRDENWSMVELQAEQLGYYFESDSDLPF